MPAPSPSWNLVRVFGTWRNLDGSPKKGVYKVSIPVKITNATDNSAIPAGTFATGILSQDAGNPSLDIMVPSTDDPDVQQTGWRVTVEVTFADRSKTERYNIEVPYADRPSADGGTGNGVNLRGFVAPELIPIKDVHLKVGVPGGIALLDSDGNALNADGIAAFQQAVTAASSASTSANNALTSASNASTAADTATAAATTAQNAATAASATTDSLMAGRVSDSASATRSALDGVYPKKANQAVNVKDYGAKGDGATDDRAAIQSALDAAGIGGNIYFPPGTYLLSSFTIANDRILKTYKDQSLFGSGRFVSTLKVGNAIGDYKTVIGCANDSTYAGRWSMSDMGIDQNSANNPLTIATMATYPKMAVRLGSYTSGSVTSVRDSAFTNGDSVNCVYVYADTIDVSGNHFLDQGGPVGTGSHDHSSIYTTNSSPLGIIGNVNVSGNVLRGVKGSGGARTGIETHGGTQAVVGNTVSGFATGMNLTGVATPNPTDGIVCTGNTVTGACIGIHLWSYYLGALTTGTATRNVIVSGNSITIDRDAWSAISGFTAYAYGILVDTGNTAPTEGLTIADNVITYVPTTSVVSGDYRSTGINLDIANAAAIVYDLQIRGNTIVNPLSAGMYLSGVIKRGRVEGNTVVNPGQSTDASVVTVYRSGIVLNRTLEDMSFERNALIDTRATHYAEYNIITSGLAVATNCIARNNTMRFTDGASPRCSFYPSASTAGTEFWVEESNAGGATPAFNVKVGSRITRTATGRTVVQTVSPVGTSWTDALALGATTGTTSPSAGAGGALPATPAGYVSLTINGTSRQIPYY